MSAAYSKRDPDASSYDADAFEAIDPADAGVVGVTEVGGSTRSRRAKSKPGAATSASCSRNVSMSSAPDASRETLAQAEPIGESGRRRAGQAAPVLWMRVSF